MRPGSIQSPGAPGPEWRRYTRDLNDYIQQNGVISVIVNGAVQARVAVTGVKALTEARLKILDALLIGDARESVPIAAQFEVAAAAARREWAKVADKRNVEAVAERHWGGLKAEVNRARGTMLAKLDAVRAKVEATTDRIDKPTARAYKADLDRMFGETTGRVDKAFEGALDAIAQAFCAEANMALKHFYAQMPVIDAGGMSARSITRERLVEAQLAELSSEDLEAMARGGLIATGVAVSAKIAALAALKVAVAHGAMGVAAFLASVGLAPLVLIGGAAAGAGVAIAWLSSVFKGQKGPILNALEVTRKKVSEYETYSGGAVHNRWIEFVKTLVGQVGAELDREIDVVGDLIKAPEGKRSLLLEEHRPGEADARPG